MAKSSGTSTKKKARPKHLYLLRHGKSSWDDPVVADQDRPLAPRGRKAAKLMAGYFRDQGIVPDLILCSSSLRTRQTLDLIAPAVGKGPTVRIEDGLYAASAEEMLARLRTVPNSAASLMLIGHNPGMQDLALLLAGGGTELPRLQTKFPTAALAALEFRDDAWRDLQPGSADLIAFVAPADLG